MKNSDLKRRILEISYKYKLSHIGSCLTAVDIIDEIYSVKKPDEKFVLSSGHAGLALYVVLEKYALQESTPHINEMRHLEHPNAENIFNHHGVHPDRCEECGIDCSSGSLGHGLGIAVGMALADRTRNVYCLISDGECSEGSVWEAFKIIQEQKLSNLKIYINYNGWGAYKEIKYNALQPLSLPYLDGVEIKYTNMNDYPEWLQGQQAHYVVMDEKMYSEALEVLK